MISPIERLQSIMARLRDPDRGCTWDREQTFETIAAAENWLSPEIRRRLQ